MEAGTSTAEELKLTEELPSGSTDKTEYAVYPIKPGESYRIPAMSSTPRTGGMLNGWKLPGRQKVGNRVVSSVMMQAM